RLSGGSASDTQKARLIAGPFPFSEGRDCGLRMAMPRRGEGTEKYFARHRNMLRRLSDTYISAHHKTHNARAAGPSQVYATTESVLFGSRRFLKEPGLKKGVYDVRFRAGPPCPFAHFHQIHHRFRVDQEDRRSPQAASASCAEGSGAADRARRPAAQDRAIPCHRRDSLDRKRVV